MRRWIAKPDWILPYTPMPENIPYQPGTGFARSEVDAEGNPISVQLYHGDSTQQLDALVDLLSNFDRFTSGRTLIAPLVEQANPQGVGEPGTAETDEATPEASATTPSGQESADRRTQPTSAGP
jgi:hypothetical protein